MADNNGTDNNDAEKNEAKVTEEVPVIQMVEETPEEDGNVQAKATVKHSTASEETWDSITEAKWKRKKEVKSESDGENEEKDPERMDYQCTVKKTKMNTVQMTKEMKWRNQKVWITFMRWIYWRGPLAERNLLLSPDAKIMDPEPERSHLTFVLLTAGTLA